MAGFRGAQIADATVTETQLATSVAGGALGGGAGTPLFVDKLQGAWTQVAGKAVNAANFLDVDTEIDAAATTDTARTDFTTDEGVFVDASGAYGVGGGSLPANGVQVTKYGNPGMIVIRDNSTKDPLYDAGNVIYGVLFWNTDDSKFYIKFFKDVAGVQTAHTMAGTETIDWQFAEIFSFANLPSSAFVGVPGNFVDLVTGDITGVTAGNGISGGGTSGTVSVAVNPADLITAGSAEIDGDKLDIDWSPTYYTPSTSPAEADNVDNLTAHLYGIDQELNTISSANATLVNADQADNPTGNSSGSDDFDTGVTIANTPKGMVYVFVNGHKYEVGDNDSNKDCYFSSDGTEPNKRAISAIAANDHLMWNPTIAGFDIATTDDVDIVYET